jgi:conjugative relaxase-like TrwC/TraI family protein
MVSIGKLGAGQARYYLEHAEPMPSSAAAVAFGVEDYYLRGQEPAGTWIGAGTSRLGLDALVSAEQLERVLAGLDPGDGSVLRVRGSVPGFDVTFSAPKSVSLLFALGDAETSAAVLAAHERAVAAAFGYLERTSAVARRGASGLESVQGEGLVGAAFVHRLSRAGDPQLHSHVLVTNMVRDASGRWTALDGRRLYAHGRTAGYLYQAALRDELTGSLGVDWGPIRKGGAEIAGVPQRAIKAFSRRRAEVLNAMALAGGVGPNAARIATFASRRAKDHRLRPDDLLEEWQLRAFKLGLAPSQISRLLHRRLPDGTELEDQDAVFAELAGPHGLTAKRSTFTRNDVLRAIAERLPAGAAVAAVEEAADAFLRSQHAVPLLVPHRGDGRPVAIRLQTGRQVVLPREPVYSTPELLTVEHRIVSRADQARGGGFGIADVESTERAIAAAPVELTDEQVEMVRRLTRDGDGIAAVVGAAGTGKTTALAAANAAWATSGTKVIGCAVARRAAHQLEASAGIPATSVTALLRRPEQIPHRGVIVLDEAGMVGTRPLAALVDHAEAAEAKLVLVGDHRQLPALEAGGALHTLAARLDAIELHENRRQREQWERDAVQHLRDGSIDRALDVYDAHDRVVIGEQPDNVMRQLVADWREGGDPANSVMIAHRRRDVAELNRRARALLHADDQLGEIELELPGGAFAVGDQVVLKLNDKRINVRNGERGTISHIDHTRKALEVRLGDRNVLLPREYLERRTASGDPTIQHGYAITAYIAQGLTCEHAYVLARDDAYREWAYTTMTRARAGSRLYVIAERNRLRDEFAPEEPKRDGRIALIAALSRSTHRGLATELERADRASSRGADR